MTGDILTLPGNAYAGSQGSRWEDAFLLTMAGTHCWNSEVDRAILGESMTDIEKQIWETLTELEAGVAAMKSAELKPDLVPLFDRLNAYSKRLPPDTHGRLIHYLANGSYEKARMWLAGRDAKNARGLCGR